jgi:cell division protein FtsB
VTQRRTPSGQGPSRRPGPSASRVRTTGAAGSTRLQHRSAMRNKARPALSRRSVNVGPGTTKRTVATRPRALTGRATVLIVVFVALALAYTYPLRVYLAQESQIAQLEADQAAQRQVIAQKSQDLQKWKDPEYVRTQAREKLFYVRQGETPLLVMTDPAGAAREAGRNAPAAAPDRWYDTLWSSVQAADAESPNR